MQNKRTTLQEVADAVGVSTMTVSRVLSGQTKQAWRSSIKRAAEIRRVAERLDYRPNAAAKAVVSGRFHALSLLHADPRKQSFFLPRTLMVGIHDALTERNLHLTSAVLPEEELDDEAAAPRLVREMAADALLVDYRVKIPESVLRLVRRVRMPSLWINAKIDDQDCIYPDDVDGGRQAARRLFELGHRRIAFVNHSVSRSASGDLVAHHSVADRLAGAQREARRNGIEIGVFQPRTPVPVAERAAWMAEYVFGNTPPTAVIAYSPFEALAVQTAAWRRGLEVPRDLSIVTFHEEPLALHGEAMTTIVIPFAKIGRKAVGHLWERVEGRGERLGHLAVPLDLAEGISTAPPTPANDGAPAYHQGDSQGVHHHRE